MKKIIALLLAAMMIVAVFASCGGGGGNGGSTDSKSDTKSSDEGGNEDTFDYTKFSDENTGKGFDANVIDDDFGGETGANLKVWAPDAYAKLLKEQCDAFAKKFADKNIKITVSVQSEDSAGTKLQTDASASADVFGFASDQLTKLKNAGCLNPVPTPFAADINATNIKNAVEVCADELDGDQTLFCYPETGNGYFLVYDKSVVSDDDAKTLEGVLAACEKAGKKFIMDAGNGYYACMFVFTGGLELAGLEKDGTTQKFNDYKEDDVVASMKAFSTLMHKYKNTFVSNGTGTIPSGFTKDSKGVSKCGAGIDGNWDSAGIKKALGDNFGASKLPTININGEDKQIVSMYGYKMIGVNSASKYPNTSQVLAYYLSSEECQNQRAEQLGWSPTNNNSVESEVVQNDVAIKALIAQSEYSVPQANVGSIWDPLANLGKKLYDDNTDPASYDFNKLLKDTVTNINM